MPERDRRTLIVAIVVAISIAVLLAAPILRRLLMEGGLW